MKNSRDAKIDLSTEDDEIIIKMDKEGAHLLLEIVGMFEDYRRFLNDDAWDFIRRNEYAWEHFRHQAEDSKAFGLALSDEILRQKTGMTFGEWYEATLANKEEKE